MAGRFMTPVAITAPDAHYRHSGRSRQHGRNRQVHVREQAHEITRPTNRDRGRRQTVFEQQQQPHDPGRALPHGGIGVGIGRAGHRQRGRKLGVTERHEGAEQPGDDERDHDRGAGKLGRGASGQHEDARPDDASNAQKHEVQRAQRPFELTMCVLCLNLRHRLALKYAP
jgi:hypothetical protein